METNKKTKQGIAVVGLVGAALAIWGITKAEAAPPEVVCTPWDEKCIGSNWCRCNPAGTNWIVVTPNATECVAPPSTAVLYGTVTDKVTGLPIDAILVSCNGYTDTTAPDGTYRIENIMPGTYAVVFTDPLGQYDEKVI